MDYTFEEIELKNIEEINFGRFFYNQPEVLSLKYDKLRSYRIFSSGQTQALIHFVHRDDRQISLPEFPFGSIESTEEVSMQMLEEFIQYLEHELAMTGVSRVEIRHYPELYEPRHYQILESIFLKTGYSSYDNINHHIALETVPFSALIHPMEKRKLDKCQQAGLSFHRENPEEISLIYDFIKECRRQKDHMEPMDKKELEDFVIAFPDNYLIFTVRKGDKIIAASIVLRVTEKVIYNFLPASLPEYNSYSPMVFLLSGLYRYARASGYQMIDLGTSMLDGKPNKGLINFKENVGGISTIKKTFYKPLS